MNCTLKKQNTMAQQSMHKPLTNTFLTAILFLNSILLVHAFDENANTV